MSLGYVAEPVIQATRRTGFEDGLKTRKLLMVRNGLKVVRTVPEINVNIDLGSRMDQIPNGVN